MSNITQISSKVRLSQSFWRLDICTGFQVEEVDGVDIFNDPDKPESLPGLDIFQF